MAASNEAIRDYGISEVLESDRELKPGIKDVEQNGDSHLDSHEDVSESDTSDQTKQNTQTSHEDIDLSNPDNVIRLLETVDLNDEDTDVLLQEAYNMNKKLKEMLRRQEADESKDKSKSKSKKKSSSSSKDRQPSNEGSRQGSAFSVKKPLPPISQEREVSNVYTVKLRRSQTNIPDLRHTHQETGSLRSKSSKPGPSQNGRGSNPRKVKQTEVTQKPEWNNRFNYT